MPSILDRIDKLRRQVDGLSRDVAAKAAAFELPAPPPEIASLVGRLRQNEYAVLVMGEAKRGKSSFINAVIGRPLLPTSVEVATSQVFRISRAEQPAYRLRFEDGSARVIGADDLVRYGSQVFADAEGAPVEMSAVIRWIEVDVPIRFLPPGIALLDTPGLGSLYAAHGRVTSRFVPMADGVIYVLDSDRPLVEADIEYISSVLERTSNIFFIQTRIDSYDREHWQSVVKRNKEILRKRFGNTLVDPRIWPISNTNLMKAAETNDEDYLAVSRFKQLSEALQAFLFRVGGLTTAAQASALMSEHHAEATRVLTRALNNLQDESRERREKSQRDVAEWQQTFQSTWGERGDKRNAVNRQLRELTSQARGEFVQTLRPGGDIDVEFLRLIERTASVDEVQALGRESCDLLSKRVSDLWRRITTDTQSACIELMLPLSEEARTLSFAGHNGNDLDIASTPIEISKEGIFSRLRTSQRDLLSGVSASGFAGGLLVAMGVVSAPLAGLAILGYGILSVLHGSREAKHRQLLQAQNELRSHYHRALQTANTQFLKVQIGQKSTVDAYFDGVEELVTSQVATIVERKSAEARAQYNQMAANAELDQKRRSEEVVKLQENLRGWQAVGRSITALGEEVVAIDRQLAEVGD